MTLPLDHIHDIDLEVSRWEFEIALSQELDGRFSWNEKDVIRPFMTHDIDLKWPWWGGSMFQIVTGVTSDIGVLSTHIVGSMYLIETLELHYILNCFFVWL